ncbi:MAG: hypothetical protein JWM11_1976 [Planctomycetaceae bacterium]|nr:hypothetical protein [Planctomycetaceae bacterium]
MSDVQQLIRELAKYAFSKRGAERSARLTGGDPLDWPDVEIPGPTWGSFFALDSMTVAQIPVLAGRIEQHQKRYPAIVESPWVERDGHIMMKVPLDAAIPIEFMKSLIDDAHEIVWEKLTPRALKYIEFAEQPYNDLKLIDQMIDLHLLQRARSDIHKLMRPAILLRTKNSPESKIAIGATKIGGQPDLPPQTKWPVFTNGKPLAFLAQLNMAELSRLGTLPIPGLPDNGVLSVFSVWGWMEDGDSDPKTPETDAEKQTGWTVIIHSPDNGLQRRPTPKRVNAFKAAAVEPTAIRSLPNHSNEPAVAALRWDKDLWNEFDTMQMDFRSIQLRKLSQYGGLGSPHQLGGYAIFQQFFPLELVRKPGILSMLSKTRSMFLQIGTDGHTDMCWGDGGELTFYADTKALSAGRFDRMWGTCQGG